MQRRRFGRTKLEVPALTYGGGFVGGYIIRSGEAEREAILNRAMAAGIDWVDTAAQYGNGASETVLGQWLAKLPAQKRPRLSTKFNVDSSAPDYAGQIAQSVKASLARLGVKHVPVLILHSRITSETGPGRDKRSLNPKEVLGRGGVVDIMDGLRKQGLCDWIGLTSLGDTAALHEVIDSGRFDVAQVYYNLLNPTAAASAGPGWNSTDFDGLLKRCQAQDMGVMGIRIFAAGHLATDERHGREMPITANTESTAEEARAKAALDALAGEKGTPAQKALRFGLACPLLSTIVIGIGEPSHLEDALKAAEMGPLPAAALDRLETVRRAHPAFRTKA
jgi:aryl-alcohol dehydrogenase-like predicted oxidoreductase